MSRKKMSVLLRMIIGLVILAAVVFFFLFLPFYGSEMVRCYPEYSWAYYPCLAFAWVFALPLFVTVFPAWQIVGTIKNMGEAFSLSNAKRFLTIAFCLCASGFIFPIGVIILAFLGAGTAPMTLVVSPLVFLGMNSLSFLCYVISRLVKEAAEIREENELTV